MAGTSAAAPARARNPLVAFIAVVFVAAALLFTMPSLAYASAEADASPQASEAQEILPTQRGGSTSVNKAPDEPPAPPSYTATDAFNVDLGAKATEVDLVSGTGDSSYTAGDDKSSVNDKDSDEDPDSAISKDDADADKGNQDADDSKADADKDSNASSSDKTDKNDSTASNGGASSNVTDEIATGSDKNQSAHPTGDSKADDSKATDRDSQSAVPTVGATSDNRGEVQKTQTSASSTTITPQGSAYAGMTIHLNQYFNGTYTAGTTDYSSLDVFDIKSYPNVQDPLFMNGSFMGFLNENLTIAPGVALSKTLTFMSSGGSFLVYDLRSNRTGTDSANKLKGWGKTIGGWYAVGHKDGGGYKVLSFTDIATYSLLGMQYKRGFGGFCG